MCSQGMAGSAQRSTEVFDTDDNFIGYACMDCNRAVFDWGADDDVWEDVMDAGWDAGHICADCFMKRAYEKDIHVTVVRWYEDE